MQFNHFSETQNTYLFIIRIIFFSNKIKEYPQCILMLKFATCQQFNDELSIMNANKQQKKNCIKKIFKLNFAVQRKWKWKWKKIKRKILDAELNVRKKEK